MKSHFLGATALAAIVFSTAPAAAADTEAMTSNALILKPLILTKQSDLSFGSIIPSGTGDFVAIDADDGSRSSATAGLLPADPGYRARFASSKPSGPRPKWKLQSNGQDHRFPRARAQGPFLRRTA